MTSAELWRSVFEDWPGSLPRKASAMTTFGETIPFVDFLIAGGGIIVQRDRPDTQGARKVIISFDAISAVKFDDPGELARYQVMGFQPPA
ncbi:MAG: hypothetical protein AAF532_16915 [Planctomycetota bacterium]